MDVIQVVHDFMDIFCMDLPSMPLDRDIEFFIHVDLGTKPVSISPYRMAITDLK